MTLGQAAAIEKAWQLFEQRYREALNEFANVGIAGESLRLQAPAFADLLTALEPLSRDDLVRRELLGPLLQLGVVNVNDDPPAAIIAPWHPMRMAAMATKARAVANLFRHMLDSDVVEVGDERLFFHELARELSHPYYPEIAVGTAGGDPTLLTVTETLDDYSLAELPITARGTARTNESPADGAQRIRDVVGRYLDLQPHENASLSVALFECDSAGLPLAAVSALQTLQESEVHCNVTLRHRDRGALQRVYNDLLEQSDADPDALVASETSRNFMAKLRVGIHIDPPGTVSEHESRQVDIAYLQDVVARRARVDWLNVPRDNTTPAFATHVPPRWAYKAATTSESATRYLTCPEQPSEGWAYISAVAAALTRQTTPNGLRRLPMRTISLADGAIRQAFQDAHNLAEWVVNYDDLLDPAQLRHQGIRVIRYQKDKSNGRNIIVSSTSRSRILDVLLRRRIDDIGLALPAKATSALVDRLISSAIDISGEIVLRASKRGTAAGELIGVALSAALIQEELLGGFSACFFLDDYAAWLGQKEAGIADLLFVSCDPTTPHKIRIVVSEAKYVGSKGAADARKTSRRQVEATVSRINDALFENPGRLDRDLWLSRLSDLLLDAMQSPQEEPLFADVRRRLRDGAVEIDLRGYSHVFVTDSEVSINNEQEALPERCGHNSFQEVFDASNVRELLRRSAEAEPLVKIREAIGAERPWSAANWRSPAARPTWMSADTDDAERPGQSDSVAAPAIVRVLPRTPRVEPPAPPANPESLAEVRSSNATAEPRMEPRATDPQNLSPEALIAARSGAAQSEDDATAWLETASKALQRALVGWGLQGKILGTRLTPNAGLVRLFGSDRLETKDIENNRQRLLTTHSLNVISVTPRPGEIVVAIERRNRQIVSLWDVWQIADSPWDRHQF